MVQESGPSQEGGANVSMPSTLTGVTFVTFSMIEGQISQQLNPMIDNISLAGVRRRDQAMQSSLQTIIAQDQASQVQQGPSQGSTNERGRSRKRTRNEKSWKKNVIESLRHSGQENTSENGKQFSAQSVKSPCSVSCSRKWLTLVSESERRDKSE